MEADDHGELGLRPVDYTGGHEADGMGATRQADRQTSRLHAEGAVAPDGGHRFSQSLWVGATTVTNVTVGAVVTNLCLSDN